MQLLFAIVFTLSCSVINGQPLVLGDVEYITECTDGLRHDIDRYLLNGTVGPKYSEYVDSGWLNRITVNLQTSPDSFCSVTIKTDGTSCLSASQSLCYCSNFDINTGFVNFIMQSSANENQNGATLFMKWTHQNGSYIESNNVTLPHIYDVKKAVVQMTVNGSSQNISDTCGSFLENSFITVTLKCSDTACVCYVKLSSGDIVVENGTSVTLTFQLGNSSLPVNLTASYSVCNNNSYTTCGSCVINIISAISATTELTISSTMENGTASVAELGICTRSYKCGLGFGLGLGVPLLILVGLGIFFYWKHKSKQRSTNMSNTAELQNKNQSNTGGCQATNKREAPNNATEASQGADYVNENARNDIKQRPTGTSVTSM